MTQKGAMARAGIEHLLSLPHEWTPSASARRVRRHQSSLALDEDHGYEPSMADDDAEDDLKRASPHASAAPFAALDLLLERGQPTGDEKGVGDGTGDVPHHAHRSSLVWPRGMEEDVEGLTDELDAKLRPDLLENSMSSLLPPPPLITETGITAGGWMGAINAAKSVYRERYKRKKAASRILPREWFIDEDLRQNVSTSGSQRDLAIRKALNNMGLKRSALQMRFHNMALQANARNIYGSDFDKCQEEIFNKNGGNTEIRHEILVQTPRRFGKTTMVAMLAAALAVFVPGIRIGIFSTVQRTSKKLMEEIFKFVCAIPGAKERVGAHNKEELHINPTETAQRGWGRKKVAADPANVSIIYSYPASVSGTRGFTVHLTIIDEAAHIDEAVWSQSIVPALGTEGMVLLALTTAQSSTNFFSQLIAKKRTDGTPLFETLALVMVCEACQLAGLTNTCTHRLNLLPAWKPRGRQELIRQILGDGESDMYAQEALGIILGEKGALFDKEKIAELQRRALYVVKRRPPTIFSFVDPSGGGRYSSQAIVSLFIDGETSVVCFPQRAHSYTHWRDSCFFNAQCTSCEHGRQALAVLVHSCARGKVTARHWQWYRRRRHGRPAACRSRTTAWRRGCPTDKT